MNTSDLIFFGLFFWVLFITVRLAIFALNIDIKLKKRLWPAIIVALGTAMVAIAWLLDFPLSGYYVFLPAVALIVFANLRGFYFCEACGRMLAHKKFLSPPKKCAKCGAQL